LSKTLFVGVDGGATKCIVRVEDESGALLGREIAGPANIRLSAEQAWHSIYEALRAIIDPLSISLDSNDYIWHAGMGLAGTELSETCQTFLHYSHPFQTLMISSDAHVACLGAHQGAPGAVIIIGTGVIGFQIQADKIERVGGWGFPHDDEGGGAWLGMEALKITLGYLDGRMPASELAHAIYAKFEHDMHEMVTWANHANSTAWATLAPIVIAQSKAGDPSAIHLLKRAASAIDKIGDALSGRQDQQLLPCALIGGIAPFVAPYLGDALQNRLYTPLATPDVGAIYLIKDKLEQ
jgi:glucosamine kinase